MRDKEKIIINDYIQGDSLSEENLDKTLNLVNKIRLLMPQKNIWIYSGYTWEQIMKYEYGCKYINNFNTDALRQAIISKCDVLIDGKYIDLILVDNIGESYIKKTSLEDLVSILEGGLEYVRRFRK